MKKIILSLMSLALVLSLVGIVSAIDYKDFNDQGIIFSPGKAYYPTVIHDGTQYLMLHDKNANYAISNDGVAWTAMGPVNGLTNPMHIVMLYDSNGFGGSYKYKIWYFDSAAAIPNGVGSIRYAESNDGINWFNDQAVFGGNMVTLGIDNVDAPSTTWGPGAVIYTSEATNTGGNPLDYSYVMYYDGYHGNSDDTTWDLHEALFLAYSIDGINWNRYTRNPVLKGGSVGEWDNLGVGYPTVMKIEDSSYVMWYGGGSGTNEGIGFATSPDGTTWTKDGSNPMFHITDTTTPAGYRADRTYTPRVIDDGTGVLKMYYSAKSDSSVYAVGLATLEIDLQPTGEITSPDENEVVFGSVEFAATYTDDDPGIVQWAVRKGTCAAGQGTIFGNVDGYHDSYSWDGSLFTATADTSSWDPGNYCFVFNPQEESDENDIRLKREFVLADTIAPIVTIEKPVNGEVVSGIVDIYGTIVEDYELSHYNIAIYPGGADFMDSSQRLEQETKYLSLGFDDKSIYQWDTTAYPDGEYLIRLAARDKAGNRDLSVDPYSGGVDSQHVITVTVDHDFDDDGVLNDDDYCPETEPDEPIVELGVNRHVWYGGGNFNTLVPAKKGEKIEADSQFSIADMKGCSCEQILDIMVEKTGLDFDGHYKFGCSKSILKDWMAGEYYVGPTFVETVEVPGTSGNPVESVNKLDVGKDFFLTVSGTYRFADWGDYGIADAEYAYRDDAYALPLPPDGWTLGETNYPSVVGLDVQVDGNNVYWGDYNPEHIYTIPFDGTGNQIVFSIYDSAYGDNSGSLYVEIMEDKWVDLW